MILLDGKITSQKITEKIKLDVQQMTAKGFRPPHLGAILVERTPLVKFMCEIKFDYAMQSDLIQRL